MFEEQPEPAADADLRLTLGGAEPSADGIDGLGAEASNTAPPNYIPPDNTPPDEPPLKPLRWGVDSLYLSYPGNLTDRANAVLAELKNSTQSSDARERASAQYEFENHLLEVSDRGRSVFAYVLRDNHFDIGLSASSSRQVPLASVQFRSDLILNQGITEPEGRLWRLMRELSDDVDEPTISRIDLYLDFVTTLPVASLLDLVWVTRADTFNRWNDGSANCLGWTFGRGDMVARLYNKSIEIEKSGKQYLRTAWRRQGWQEHQTVWRLEFQFRRGILKAFGPIGVAEIPEESGNLWHYGSVDWLRLTDPNPKDSNRSRWPTNVLWKSIQAIDWGSSNPPTQRQVPTERVPSDDWLFVQGLGPLTSYMAKKGIRDLEAANDAFLADAKRFHRLGRDEPIETYIDKRVSEKGRRFNTLRNPKPEPEDDE